MDGWRKNHGFCQFLSSLSGWFRHSKEKVYYNYIIIYMYVRVYILIQKKTGHVFLMSMPNFLFNFFAFMCFGEIHKPYWCHTISLHYKKLTVSKLWTRHFVCSFPNPIVGQIQLHVFSVGVFGGLITLAFTYMYIPSFS